MGRSIFDKYAQPEKDDVKAVILERINALHITAETGSKIMGVSVNTYAKRINHQHTNEWSLGEIKNMCRALKVEVADLRGAVHL